MSTSPKNLLRKFIRTHLNLSEQVKKKFNMQLPADLLNISSVFKKSGHQLYVVGGSVRDVLQGKTPHDYDLATDAVPDKVIEILQDQPGYKLLGIGKSFGVIVVMTPEGGEYEISTFRKDIGKGRRPDSVEFTNIENDVKRRDLTINALFYDIDKHEIVDYVGGIEDIKNGVVRTVGDPFERFDEDRLRILRALRFAARMGSKLDQGTSDAILADNTLKGVSPERIRDEFLKGVKSARSPVQFSGMIESHGLWPQVFPGLIVTPLTEETSNIPVVLSLLLRDNDVQNVAKRLNALKYNAIEIAQITFLLKFKDIKPNTAFRLKKAFATSHLSMLDVEVFADKLNGSTFFNDMVFAFIDYRLSVTGDQLMKDGFTGAELGKELERRETELFNKLL